MSRTVSAYTDDRTAEAIEVVAKIEHRKVSHVAGAALSLYVRLPGAARAGLRTVEALGTPEQVERLTRELARVIVASEFAVAQEQLVATMHVPDSVLSMDEDELLDEAVRFTSRRVSDHARERTQAALDAHVRGST